MTEKEFRQQILDLARLCGWLCYFTWRSIHSPAGFPDLCMVRENKDGTAMLCFLELKAEGKEPTPAQKEWLDILGKVPGVIARCVRPSQWDEIVECLR